MVNTSVNTPSSDTPNKPDQKQGAVASMRVNTNNLLQSSDRLNAEKREYSEVFRPTDVVSIPDVHGDLRALRLSLEVRGLIDSDGNWTGSDTVVELLGDYIDRGKQNLAVLDYLIQLKGQAEEVGGWIDLILGNHEAILLGAIANVDEYRDGWLDRNYGQFLFDEVVDRHHLRGKGNTWGKMAELFLGSGPYAGLFRSMKVASQVDDVLYFHGGLSDTWADDFERDGVKGVNERWEAAFDDLNVGFTDKFKAFSKNAPFWVRYRDMKDMSEEKVAKIAKALKAHGINVLVVAHDRVPHGPEMYDEGYWEKYGIKLIASDVGMSEGYGGYSSHGSVKVDQKGNIDGRYFGKAKTLHDEDASGRSSVAA